MKCLIINCRCKVVFDNLMMFVHHKSSCKTVKGKTFRCAICDERFGQQEKMKDHVRTHVVIAKVI